MYNISVLYLIIIYNALVQSEYGPQNVQRLYGTITALFILRQPPVFNVFLNLYMNFEN